MNSWRALVLPLATVALAGCGGGNPAPDSAIADGPAAGDPGSVVAQPVGGASPRDSVRDSVPAGGDLAAVAPRAPVQPAAGRAPAQEASGTSSPRPRPAPDTVRGVVSEVGSVPRTSVVVRTASGGSITVTGPLAREIARAAGAELWISGERTAQGIAARAYAVRTVDGEAAVDGILARDGDRIVLVTAGGRRAIAQPLQAFRGMIGARVWLVGPLDGTIASYGVLRDP